MGRTSLIRVPGFFDARAFKDFLNEFLPAFRDSQKIVLDFSSCRFPDIDALVLLQMYEDISRAQGKNIEYSSPNMSEPHILEKMLSLFKKDHGSDSSTFETFFAGKLHQITRSMKTEEVRTTVNKLDKVIQDQFAATRQVAMALSYCTGEITDNSAVHGYENYAHEDLQIPIYTAAWGLENSVKIVIADRGVGIVKSLKKKKPYHRLSKSEILRESLKKGVTGHPVFSPGFGLYGVSEIVRRSGGEMTIISNGVRLEIRGGEVLTSSISSIAGTFISIEIKKNVPIPLEDIIGPASMDNMEFLLDLQ